MLFFYSIFLKNILHIKFLLIVVLLSSCNGSKKYFKAAERLEKQGLVNEAAEYYMESLQRKPTSVDAKVKLKNVGQKYASNLASDFFRNYNTQQTETSLEIFERLKEFTTKAAALSVVLDYPKNYEDDYQKSVEAFCSKNYDQAYALVNQKKFDDALISISKIKKYNPNFKNTSQLEVISFCEPLYQSAVISIENKNYTIAFSKLSGIKSKTETYKDSKDLFELSLAAQTKNFILIHPKSSVYNAEKDIEESLFNNFTQEISQKFTSIQLINNTPFTETSGSNDLLNNTNVDLIQAIRKATGADYFYTYDVSNKREVNNGPLKSSFTAYQEVKVRKNDTLVVTEYNPIGYNVVKGSRIYSYDFKYKIINAFSNQIVSTQTQNVSSQDAIEYNEFARNYNGNINNLYPYNPLQTAPAGRYNPKAWRGLFSAKSTLKSFEELRSETINKTITIFTTSVSNNMK